MAKRKKEERPIDSREGFVRLFVEGCYYPGCDEPSDGHNKWCLAHEEKYGGPGSKIKTNKEGKSTMTKTTKSGQAAKKAAKKTTPKKATKKTTPKKAAKKTTPKKAAKKSASKRKKVQPKKIMEAVNWMEELTSFGRTNKQEFRIEMGSPGSAQVTRVRMQKKPYCKGLNITTEGTYMIFNKTAASEKAFATYIKKVEAAEAKAKKKA